MKRSRNFVPRWSQGKDGLYWIEWAKVKAVLMRGRETWTKAEEEKRRHAFHVEIFGADKSHVDFTNDDFDKFLAACKAIIEPGNLQAQLDALNGRKKRLKHGIIRLAAELGVDLAYVDGIVEAMNENGALGASNLDNLDEDALAKVRVALEKQARRGMTVAAPVEEPF